MSKKLNRRSFLQHASAMAGATLAATGRGSAGAAKAPADQASGIQRISEVVNPLAITMVDYSWLLKHHRYGAYDDYDRFFTELVDRGYNAVRMDCFPQWIAADRDGCIEDSFWHKKDDRKTLLWGHDFSIRSNPRQSLVEFLTKCREYSVHAGLSTWFIDHGTDRTSQFKGVDDFVRAWHETLSFIKQNGLMDVVTYVDLLNEYPMAHGFGWLHDQVDGRGSVDLFRKNNPEANIPPAAVFDSEEVFNPIQIEFYQSFMRESIDRLKAAWPDLDFFTSETGRKVPQDYSNFDAIDKHFWFIHNKQLAAHTGFRRMTHNKPSDVGFHEIYHKGLKHWDAHKAEYGDWMEGRIEGMAALGRQYGIPVGNTEGWGAVFWEDNPTIDWRFIRESAEISVPLAVKHGYKFICTSNFTCPQFVGMWEDVAWHRSMTEMIRAGSTSGD